MDAHRDGLAELDQAIRPRSGPSGAPLRALFGGIVGTILSSSKVTVLAAADFLTDHSVDDDGKQIFEDRNARQLLQFLHLEQPPSRDALYRTLSRLVTKLEAGDLRPLDRPHPMIVPIVTDETADGRKQALMDFLLWASAPDLHHVIGTWALDTSLFNACCRPIARDRYDAGERASDPDASARTILRANGVEEHYFGYGIQTAVRRDGSRDYTDRLRVIPAGQNDRPQHVENVRSMVAAGNGIRHAVIDRGIASADVHASMREVGVDPVFDLKAEMCRHEGDYRGLLIIDGSLYSPAIPERLWHLPTPAPNAPDDKAAWIAAMDERERYLWKPKQRLGPGKVQLARPRHVGCRHPRLHHTMRFHDPSLRACPGHHASDEACGLTTVVWEAHRAPSTWQLHARGSAKWRALYAERSAVERSYSLLQNPDIVDLRNKNIRMRGKAKWSIMCALAFVATNTHLWALDDPKTNSSKPRTPPRRRPAPPPPTAEAA